MCKLVEVMTNDGRVCRVADIKKDYIVNIIRNANVCPAIDEIILTSKSYRDFARKIYQFGKFQNYDLLYFRNDRKIKDHIFGDISRGEVIYRKEGEENGK